MLFVSRKFLILLLVRRQRSLIRILCLFFKYVIRLMLTRQNIIVNKKRLIDYEKSSYLCRNKQDFCDCLANPDKISAFALLCDSLGLELKEQRVDYYPVELVGEQSPYFEREDKGDFDKYGFPLPSTEACYAFIDDEFNISDFLAHIVPIQLELPFK